MIKTDDKNQNYYETDQSSCRPPAPCTNQTTLLDPKSQYNDFNDPK